MSSEQPSDKGLRKFKAMVISQGFLFAGFLLAGWRGWVNLFDIYTWGVFGVFCGFAVPNVVEHFANRMPRKKKTALQQK